MTSKKVSCYGAIVKHFHFRGLELHFLTVLDPFSKVEGFSLFLFPAVVLEERGSRGSHLFTSLFDSEFDVTENKTYGVKDLDFGKWNLGPNLDLVTIYVCLRAKEHLSQSEKLK